MFQTGWHHITNRGLDRRAVFRSTDDRLDFGRLLGSACDRFDVRVLAYCLMDNHYHLVVDCPDGGLSAFMQDVSAKFTRHANERHGGDGPIFRGRFFSRPVLSEQYLCNAVRYVHRNPLAIRPPVGLRTYRWSSHRTYVGLRRPPDWLSCTPVLDWFSSADFARFVEGPIDVPARVEADIDTVLCALMLVVDTFADDLARSPQGLLRTASYLVLSHVEPACRESLVAWLAPSTPDALRQAIWRAERAARSEPRLLTIVDHTLELLTFRPELPLGLSSCV